MTRALRERLAGKGASCAIALTVPPHLTGLAGFAYFLFGPVLAIQGKLAGRRRRRFDASTLRRFDGSVTRLRGRHDLQGATATISTWPSCRFTRSPGREPSSLCANSDS